jgi:hypothetical protein
MNIYQQQHSCLPWVHFPGDARRFNRKRIPLMIVIEIQDAGSQEMLNESFPNYYRATFRNDFCFVPGKNES